MNVYVRFMAQLFRKFKILFLKSRLVATNVVIVYLNVTNKLLQTHRHYLRVAM